MVVGVIGCMAQRLGDKLLEHEAVNLVCGPAEIPQIERLIKEALKESQNRVYSMSAVHETLYSSGNLSEILVKPFIERIVKFVYQSYQINSNQVSLKTEFDAIKLNIDKASPVGLVVNELVSNALKHAFPDGRDGEIALSIKKLNPEELEIIIKDNGVGMPVGLDWTKAEGLGLQLVKNIVENQLDGSLSMKSDKGTQFVIRFKTERT